jgi:hypothetical protein
MLWKPAYCHGYPRDSIFTTLHHSLQHSLLCSLLVFTALSGYFVYLYLKFPMELSSLSLSSFCSLVVLLFCRHSTCLFLDVIHLYAKVALESRLSPGVWVPSMEQGKERPLVARLTGPLRICLTVMNAASGCHVDWETPRKMFCARHLWMDWEIQWCGESF